MLIFRVKIDCQWRNLRFFPLYRFQLHHWQVCVFSNMGQTLKFISVIWMTFFFLEGGALKYVDVLTDLIGLSCCRAIPGQDKVRKIKMKRLNKKLVRHVGIDRYSIFFRTFENENIHKKTIILLVKQYI